MLVPSHVRSAYDGQLHYISAEKLILNYELHHAANDGVIVFDRNTHDLASKELGDFVWLGPRTGGDYLQYRAAAERQWQQKQRTTMQSIAKAMLKMVNPQMKMRKEQLAHVQSMVELAERLVQECDNYPVDIPEAKSGKWRIDHRVVTADPIMNIKFVLHDTPESVTSSGVYTVLSYIDEGGQREVMMSNTQLEYRTNVEFVRKAEGHVLVTGLGIGMILRPLAAKPEVLSITVLEKSLDVIGMVAPHYDDIEKLRVLHADAFTYAADRKFDWAMHDIWPHMSHMNLTEMYTLKRMYAASVTNQVCWAEDICVRMADQLRGLRQHKKKMGQ